MGLPASVGSPGRVLPRARFLFLFEAPSQVEAGGARSRPAGPASLSVKPTRGRAAGVAPGTLTMSCPKTIAVQEAIGPRLSKAGSTWSGAAPNCWIQSDSLLPT